MDPLSQGMLGASLPQALTRGERAAAAGLFGCLGGMAPDLDVLIRSPSDPLMFLEYHRQFSHALAFIPVGGVICGLLLYWLLGRRWQLSAKESCLYATLGYATHALLDACTSFGTQLLWPFSDTRFAWNVVSVIDPLFTLPMLALVVTAGLKKRPLYARLALLWALAYLGMGLLQRDRAVDAGLELAAQRGHRPMQLEAKPSFANLLVWKTVYASDDTFYVDAVRVGAGVQFYPGEHVEMLDVSADLPWLQVGSQQAIDIERFRRFSAGYVALDPQNSNRVIDVRYSMIPNEVNALWSIELDSSAPSDSHVRYLVHRDTSPERNRVLRDMLLGR
ncbi:MAG: metal-dependent hydrolase [Gammaproteobacteria bacterium]